MPGGEKSTDPCKASDETSCGRNTSGVWQQTSYQAACQDGTKCWPDKGRPVIADCFADPSRIECRYSTDNTATELRYEPGCDEKAPTRCDPDGREVPTVCVRHSEARCNKAGTGIAVRDFDSGCKPTIGCTFNEREALCGTFCGILRGETRPVYCTQTICAAGANGPICEPVRGSCSTCSQCASSTSCAVRPVTAGGSIGLDPIGGTTGIVGPGGGGIVSP